MNANARKNDGEAENSPRGTPKVTDNAVSFFTIDEASEGQRLDNFLLKIAKGVPKSHLYRLVRSGEVRVNKKRASVDQRLLLGDLVRVPPVRVSQSSEQDRPAPALRSDELPILFEDAHLLIVNKPAGMAAHGGSGVAFGLIERLRSARAEAPFLELAHRLDRDTSGALILCKSRKALVRLHEMQREGQVEKHYRLLVVGDWVNERQHVKLPLKKFVLSSGERRVRVDEEEGLSAHTIFTCLERFGDVTLLDAELKTGRTHQIRVHAAASGHALVGDNKYGDYERNVAMERGALGIAFKRMFLHAYELVFEHPVTHEKLRITAPMDKKLTDLLASLKSRSC